MTDTTDEHATLSRVLKVAEPSHATEDQLWAHLNTFYNENEKTIEKCKNMDVRALEKLDTAEFYLDSFLESSRVVLDGLVALANVHPVLGVAILAFHAVVSLDIARRDNDRKVRTVMLQMQNMMCTMFQLRGITFAHTQGLERHNERERLQALVKAIADDITQCGSDLNYYMDQRFISKMIKAKSFERRFQSHVENFIDRRAQLQSVLTAFIAAGVDSANRGITNVENSLVNVNTKLDEILNALFRRLDTPRERETQLFLDENGGVEICITKDELLLKLISLAGDVISESSSTKGDSSKLSRSRTRLLEEFTSDLDLAFEQNFRRFEKLLVVQNSNFERLSAQLDRQEHYMRNESEKLDYVLRTSLLILDQGTMIRKAVGYNFALKLSDPDLQQLWDMMGLKRSVKAKVFVLSLRDYLLDTGADAWVLDYIDVAHMQAIVEAIDEDCSGFITVNEANKFALSRPEGWSLLEWIVYWAAAWHISITEYRKKIYSILMEMHNLLPVVHPANYVIVDDYLDSYGVLYVEALLRSTKELPSNNRLNSKLSDLSASYAAYYERILKNNLDTISFSIASDADISLVAGTSRVETWIYPLLCLVLERHLSIMKLSLVHILDKDELYRHSNTLLCIFQIFLSRTNDLEVIFNQLHGTAAGRLECFAHGMFSTTHTFVSNGFDDKNNLLAKRKRGTSPGRMIELCHEASSLKLAPLISPKGTLPSFVISGTISSPSVATQTQAPYSLNGYWSGLCWRLSGDKAPFRGLFHCTLSTFNDNRIQGAGESYAGSFNVDGTFRTTSSGIYLVDFKMSISDGGDDPILCHGLYNEDNDTFDLKWICNPSIEGFPIDSKWDTNTDGNDRGVLNMTRTPAEFVRFRHILHGDQGDARIKSLARRRWSYALTAILCQVQGSLGSMTFWRSRILERDMWIEYTIRYMLDRSPSKVIYDRKYLHYEHLVKMFELTGIVHPALGRIYEEMAKFLCDRQYFNKIGPLIICDFCGYAISFSRYQCVTCLNDAQSVDFCADCPNCIQHPFTNAQADFFHHPSHTLLRTTRRIQRHDLSDLLSQCRIRSERVKRTFRALKEASNSEPSASAQLSGLRTTGDGGVFKPAVIEPPTCTICRENISLPCWVCATCDLDTAICSPCEAAGQFQLGHRQDSGPSSLHSRHHPLLRIQDSVSVVSPDVKDNRADTQLSALTTELRSLKNVVSNRLKEMATNESASKLSLLEGPENSLDLSRANADRISALESRFEDRMTRLEATIDGQFSSIMELLQKIAIRDIA